MLKKFLKVLVFSIVIVLVTLAFAGVLFVKFSPEFGGKHAAADIERYKASGHYENGKFQNIMDTNMDMNAKEMMELLPEFLRGVPNSEPDFEVPIQHLDSAEIAKVDSVTKVIWFGHSAFLIHIDGKHILLDPMLGPVPAPHPWLGKKRYEKELPIEIEQLPNIDAIIISHDHYDHLDYGSIQKLKAKTRQFFVPLGVGAHFREWGVSADQIQELNWWDEVNFEGTKLAFTPSRHFSGRGPTDRWSTMWGSWVIIGQKDKLYFSGDGGYGAHFKQIGDTYGPFDFAMMECGQYNKRWADIHMMPEETAQAAMDVRAKVFMPIHWASFTLALHSWTDPVVRVLKKSKEINQPIYVPMIGQEVDINTPFPEQTYWWEKPN